MCCVEKVSQLLNRPGMNLFGTRMSGTIFSDDRDLTAHGHDEESLSETRRPDFISTVRPDLSQ
jgi:hypothetical protein